MEDGFDVVPVRVQSKGSVIAKVIRPFSRPAIVAPAMGEGGFMEGLNAAPVPGLKGEVDVGSRAIGLIDPQFIAGEVPGAFRREIAPDRFENGAIEASARLEV
jgi:hypothetical protein